MNIVEYKELSKKIIGDAFSVYNEYKGGLLESAYQAAFVYLLRKDGFKFEEKNELPLFFRDVRLSKTYRMDIVINNQIILELKAVEEIRKEHRLQLFHYMRLTHIPIGLLINFSYSDGVHFEKYHFDETENRCKAF